MHWEGLYALATFADAKEAIRYWTGLPYTEDTNIWCPLVAAFAIALSVQILGADITELALI